MVIRRIREHVASHNWFAVSVDLAIVVVGVFLATQVNNWNEARLERDLGRNYRERMVVELHSDEAQIRQKIAYYESVKRHGLSFLAALRSSRSLGTDFLVDAYQLTQIDPTRGKRFIFDEMVNGGMLSLLGNEEEQRLSADFYQQLETYNATLLEVLPYRDIMRQELPYEVQAEIREHCDDQNVMRNGAFVGIRLPEECPIKLSSETVSAAVAKVRAIPKIESLATRYISSVDQKLGTFRFTLNQVVELRTALSKSD